MSHFSHTCSHHRARWSRGPEAAVHKTSVYENSRPWLLHGTDGEVSYTGRL